MLLSYPLLHVSDICNTSFVTEDCVRYSSMHTSKKFFSDTVLLLLLLEYVFVMTLGSVSKASL